MVERLPGMEDRRVIHVNLTGKGRKTIEECDKLIRDSIRQKLSTLSSGDLEELVTCTARLREIGAKLE
jgi:DNA-binding MarR family transcriptional regulator